jgi:hypothetical protein
MNRFIASVILLLASFSASSHPGNTAADGCHYCRTNCGQWGVPYGVRHCHNGYSEEEAARLHGMSDGVYEASHHHNHNHSESDTVIVDRKEKVLEADKDKAANS